MTRNYADYEELFIRVVRELHGSFLLKPLNRLHDPQAQLHLPVRQQFEMALHLLGYVVTEHPNRDIFFKRIPPEL